MNAIFADLMQYPSSHSRECLRQNRCVCGHFERQNADFEARLKRAMESRPVVHASDCAVHNEPAYPNGLCNCGAQPQEK